MESGAINIAVLPNEIMVMILEYLDDDALDACAGTSRALFALIRRDEKLREQVLRKKLASFMADTSRIFQQLEKSHHLPLNKSIIAIRLVRNILRDKNIGKNPVDVLAWYMANRAHVTEGHLSIRGLRSGKIRVVVPTWWRSKRVVVANVMVTISMKRDEYPIHFKLERLVNRYISAFHSTCMLSANMMLNIIIVQLRDVVLLIADEIIIS